MKKSLIELAEELDAHFKPADAHVAQVEPSRGALVFPLALAVACAEAWGIYCTAQGMPLYMLLAAHLVIASLLAVLAIGLYRAGRDSRFVFLLCLLTLAAGPFGAVGVMVAILANLYGRRTYHSFDEFFESLSPSAIRTRAQAIYDDIMSGRDDASEQHSVIPFLDVISFGSEVQKRQALAKMTNHYQPDFAGVFRKALNDPSNMIRVQAATAIARVESQFIKRMNKLSIKKLLGESNPKMLRAVAEHYDNYAYTGLLDKDSEAMNRSKALELYTRCLELTPDDHEIYIRIGRVMMRNGEYAQACDWFGRYIETQPEDIPVSLTDWYSESLFMAGRYGELRRLRVSLPKAATRSDLQLVTLKGALELWEGRHAAS